VKLFGATYLSVDYANDRSLARPRSRIRLAVRTRVIVVHGHELALHLDAVLNKGVAELFCPPHFQIRFHCSPIRFLRRIRCKSPLLSNCQRIDARSIFSPPLRSR